MPVRTKKKRTSSSVKKKTSTKKRTGRSRTSRSKKKRNHKKNFITVLSVFLMIGFVIFGYHLGQENGNTHANEEIEDEYYESPYTTKQLLDDLMKMQQQKPKELQPPEPKKVVQKIPPKAEKPKQIEKPKPVKEVKKRLINLSLRCVWQHLMISLSWSSLLMISQVRVNLVRSGKPV